MTTDKIIEVGVGIFAQIIILGIFVYGLLSAYSKKQDARHDKLMEVFHAQREDLISIKKDAEFAAKAHSDHTANDKVDFANLNTGVAGLHIATEGLRQRIEGRTDVIHRGRKAIIGDTET